MRDLAKWRLHAYTSQRRLIWTGERYHKSYSRFLFKILRAPQVVGVNAETVTNISSTDFPGHYPGEDQEWDIREFKKVISI